MKIFRVFNLVLSFKFTFCGKIDLDPCSYSDECISGCCSKVNSDDGRLKCQPIGSTSDCSGN